MKKTMTVAGLIVAAMLVPTLANAADAPKAFQQCMACHKVEPGKHAVGPSLFGVYDRKAASVADFKYSPAMSKFDAKWDEATLTTYLAAPMKVVPGTKMAFVGLKNPDDIKATIEYLKTLK